jgi:hypothetical protein
MSLWNGIHPGLREKALKSIRHTLKTEILSHTTVDDTLPVVEPVPVPEMDPDVLAAFLAEPDPDEVNLALLAPRTRSTIQEKGVVCESSVVRNNHNDDRGNDEDDNSAAEDEDGIDEDGIDEDVIGEDSDVENLEFSEEDDI